MKKLTGLLTGAIATVGLTVAAQAADIKGAHAYGTADTMAFASINVEQLRSSALFTFAKLAIAGQKKFVKTRKEIKDGTGFDLLEDPTSATFFAGKDIQSNPTSFVAVIESSKFDEKKIVAFVAKKGAKITDGKCAKGGAYHDIDGQAAMAFRGNFALLGGKDMLCKALEKGGLSGDLKKAAGDLNLGWTFSGAGMPEAKMLKGAPTQLQGLKWASANFNLSGGAELKASGEYGAKKAAAKTRNFAKKELKKFKASKAAKQAPVNLDSIKIGGKGKLVTVGMKITPDELKTIIGMAGGMMGVKGGK